MANSAGFGQVNEENVAEPLNSHREELSNEDLLELDKEYHEEEEPIEDEIPPQVLKMKHTDDASKLDSG
jgi:hypothetical protein